jgi:hypothetical protein
LLRDAWDRPPDENGWAHIQIGEGKAELFATTEGDPISGLCFNRPSGGRDILDFIVDVARAGDMVIFAPGTPVCCVSADQLPQLPATMVETRGTRLIESGEALESVLRKS